MAVPAGLPSEHAPAIIGQITHHLDHMANMLGLIDEHEYDHCLNFACTDSFLVDFRALHGFLLGGRKRQDAHRYDFLSIAEWQYPKGTAATKRTAKLVDVVSKHRAHLSNSRFVQTDQRPQDVLGVRRLTPTYLAHILLDYLDVLDDFINHLPDTSEAGKLAWQGASFNARYKTEVRLGIRENDFPEHAQIKPFKSVIASLGVETSPQSEPTRSHPGSPGSVANGHH